MNAANEVAVKKYLEKKINFLDISKYVKLALEKYSIILNPNLEDVLAADLWARNKVTEMIEREEILEVNF